MNYVFVKLKIDKDKNNKENKFLFIECKKLDNSFNELDVYINKLKLNDKKAVDLIKDFKKIFKGSVVIGYDLSLSLIDFLIVMYEYKIYDFSFRYFDMKDYINYFKSIDSVNDMINIMRNYSDNNLDSIKYTKNKCIAYRIFRGLNYKLYLLDNGYYIYDKSIDRCASFYIHKKELAKDWNYTEDEYIYLKNNGANFITNIFHISEDTIKYTNEYTIYSSNDLNKYEYMIEKMEKALIFLEQHSNLYIELVCIGSLEELKENYKILGKEKIDKIIKLITRQKELWSEW